MPGAQLGQRRNLLRPGDLRHHPVRQSPVRLGVDADGGHVAAPGHCGASKTLAVRHAADHAVRPPGLVPEPGQDRGFGEAEVGQSLAGAAPDGGELPAPPLQGAGHERGLLGEQIVGGQVGVRLDGPHGGRQDVAEDHGRAPWIGSAGGRIWRNGSIGGRPCHSRG